MLAGAVNPVSACTYGLVKERKVAITGLAIRTRYRFFRIAGLLPLFFACFAEFFAPYDVGHDNIRLRYVPPQSVHLDLSGPYIYGLKQVRDPETLEQAMAWYNDRLLSAPDAA